jgi:hypothetical protein
VYKAEEENDSISFSSVEHLFPKEEEEEEEEDTPSALSYLSYSPLSE